MACPWHVDKNLVANIQSIDIGGLSEYLLKGNVNCFLYLTSALKLIGRIAGEDS
jgi:hypothetical protein